MTQTADLIHKMAEFFTSEEFFEKGEDARLELSPDDVRCMNELIHTIGLVKAAPNMQQCKNCRWWKDSDGLYRRGGHAESQCPINRREVFEGN